MKRSNPKSGDRILLCPHEESTPEGAVEQWYRCLKPLTIFALKGKVELEIDADRCWIVLCPDCHAEKLVTGRTAISFVSHVAEMDEEGALEMRKEEWIR